MRIAGREMLAVAEDVPRLRDGLGIPVPPGVAASFTEPAAHPIDDLVLRWARTHGPFVAVMVAERYGLGRSVVENACRALAGPAPWSPARSSTRPGRWPPRDPVLPCPGAATDQTAVPGPLRQGVEPVEPVAYARFLAEWQGLELTRPGPDAVLSTIEQLSGYAIPASALESVVLPARVANYRPAMLDELTSSGEIFWVGDGPIGENDGWVRWYVGDPEPHAADVEPATWRGQELLAALGGGGAYFFDALLPSGVGVSDRSDYVTRCGTWSGPGRSPGTPLPPSAPGSAVAHTDRPAGPPPGPTAPGWPEGAGPPGPGRRGCPPRPRPGGGRWWSATRCRPAARLAGDVFALLDRYGVVTRGSVITESSEGGFGAAYRALSSLEESGQCRRGYFVNGLGAAQFALTGAVDRLRAQQREPEQPQARVLAACDPANPYGAALPWPEREGHRPGRKAGALVVLVDGALVFYVERGGKTLLSFTEDPVQLGPAAEALARAVRLGQLGKLTVERADGGHVFGAAPVSEALQQAGFRMTPQGLRLRPAPV